MSTIFGIADQPTAAAALIVACPFLERHRTEYWECGDTIVFGHVARLLQRAQLPESEAEQVWRFFNKLADSDDDEAVDALATGAIETFNDDAESQRLARRFLYGRALELLEQMRLHWGQPDYDDEDNPPRNGEAAARRADGGVDSDAAGPSAACGGPRPRSREERGRIKHRTVGASDRNVRLARQLRRKMTLPEVLLWQQLRKRPDGLRFSRQFPLRGYILDFACLERRVAIEVDGAAHSMGDIPERDRLRDEAISKIGFETLRIAARDVLDNLEGVLTMILRTCKARPLHQPSAGSPPRSGEDLR